MSNFVNKDFFFDKSRYLIATYNMKHDNSYVVVSRK